MKARGRWLDTIAETRRAEGSVKALCNGASFRPILLEISVIELKMAKRSFISYIKAVYT